MTTTIPNEVWVTDPVDLPADFPRDKVPAPILELAIQSASTILYNLTRQRWPGSKTTTVWPRGGVIFDSRDGWFHAVSELHVDRYPVTAIREVKIDGEIIEPEFYRIDNGRVLVWNIPEDATVGDRKAWPVLQRLSYDDGTNGTWSVTLDWGEAIPPEARKMAGMLASQLAQAMSPLCECSLPPFIQSQARRGATVVAKDPMALIANGQTGYLPVDMWLASLNYGQSKKRARIIRPGWGRNTRIRGQQSSGS